jgi:uncharacterized protein
VIYEWDAGKAAANIKKHQIWSRTPRRFSWILWRFTFPDPDHSGEEQREITIGHTSNEKLVFVAHSERAGRINIISARFATALERKQYEEGFT